MASSECQICYHTLCDCWCEPRCTYCSRRRSFMLQKGVRFWFQQSEESCGWSCGRCCEWDPTDPRVKSDLEGYTQWTRWRRDEPSNEPEQDMQTWREFRGWGIVVKESANN